MGPRYEVSILVNKKRPEIVYVISTKSLSPWEASQVDAPHSITRLIKRDPSA